METTNKHSQNGAPTSNGNPSATAKPSAGEGQENSENSGRRSDENRLHILKHGILSRNLLEALVERGESVREWRDLIRELRTDLQVEGPLAGVYFDRLCASMMREALISNAERAIFVATDENPGFEARLKQANLVAIATMAQMLTVRRPPIYCDICRPCNVTRRIIEKNLIETWAPSSHYAAVVQKPWHSF